MVTALVIVTLVSLVMTIVLAGVVVKLLRDERRRSDARVSILTQMADAAEQPRPTTRTVAEQPAPPARRAQPAVAPTSPVPTRPPVGSPRHIALHEIDNLNLDRTDSKPRGTDLFIARQERSAWPRRLGIVAAMALVLVTIGLAIRSTIRTADPGSTPVATTGPAFTQTSPGLLELLSLKHAQEAGTLTITGLVQNPRGGAALSKIAATAFLFSADGTFLASGRAPLDFTVLRPGDESGFVISIPVTVPVARYRVGFRGEDGRIIGHVDRRGTSTMARNEP
jgi:hypothetical protein